MSARHYIACDLGAESGRVMLGRLEDDRITLEEIHRFPNGPITAGDSLRWDVARIFEEIKTGVRLVAERGIAPESISCDSWGVDYALVKSDGSLAASPFHYRDRRTDGALERAFSVVPETEIFEATGVQFMPINTLYQLRSEMETQPAALDAAGLFLNIGDYFNFLLSGVPRAEESLASTTQLYDPSSRSWSDRIIEGFRLPRRVFPEVVHSGTVLGPLARRIGDESGLRDVRVIAGCSHDTAAAVAAVPAEGRSWAYLSSGTWSLLGVERAEPVLTDLCRKCNFTNEIGFGGVIRLLKNIPGLWIVQECRREWSRQGTDLDYDQLTVLAESAPASAARIDPLDPTFSAPGDIPSRIVAACAASGHTLSATPGNIVRCVLESLADLYRRTLDQLEELTGQEITRVHVVGGGSRNAFLNRLTADASGRTVFAGPPECSSLGNILVQSIALGHLPSLDAARNVVRNSFPIGRIDPSSGVHRATTASASGAQR